MSATTIRRPRLIRNEKGGRFRLLVGVHFGQGPKGCLCEACLTSDGKNHNFQAGDVIDSPSQDLERRFNQGPYSRKFERVADDTPLAEPWGEEDDVASPPTNTGDGGEVVTEAHLQKMSVGQLRKFAEENSIDLQGKTVKAEVLELVLTALTD